MTWIHPIADGRWPFLGVKTCEKSRHVRTLLGHLEELQVSDCSKRLCPRLSQHKLQLWYFFFQLIFVVLEPLLQNDRLPATRCFFFSTLHFSQGTETRFFPFKHNTLTCGQFWAWEHELGFAIVPLWDFLSLFDRGQGGKDRCVSSVNNLSGLDIWFTCKL